MGLLYLLAIGLPIILAIGLSCLRPIRETISGGSRALVSVAKLAEHPSKGAGLH